MIKIKIQKKKRNSTLVTEVAEIRRKSDIIEDIDLGASIMMKGRATRSETLPILAVNESDEDYQSSSSSHSSADDNERSEPTFLQ